MERLDKAVSTYGDLPRSEAVRHIRHGQVRVDGEVCRNPACKMEFAAHTLTVAGRAIDCRPHRYLMMNKPAGILCVSRDPKAETVVDLLPPSLRRRGLFPAGRLDKDTVGLVLLTDDGDYAHRLLSPKKAVFKRYRAMVEGEMPAACEAVFAAGTTLADGTVCLPARLTRLEPAAFFAGETECLCNDNIAETIRNFSAKYRIDLPETSGFVEIAIQEGQYHQIKRMCASVGHKVLWLKRLSIGELQLDPALSEGECRELSAEETAAAFQSVEGICAK